MRLCRTVSIFFFAILFIGCQADVFKVSDKAPTISIKKIGERKTLIDDKALTDDIVIKIQLVADRAPKTDLLVLLDVFAIDLLLGKRGVRGWATIPQGKKSSIVFSQYVSINSYGYASISPIPTVSVVGKGEVINMDKLSNFWGDKTLEDQLIPRGFQFPYYRVATPAMELHRPGIANIISVDPPNGSEVDWKSKELFPDLKPEITIIFDNPPEHPKLRVDGHDSSFSHLWPVMSYEPGFKDNDEVGNVFSESVEDSHFTGNLEVYRFTVKWGHEDVGTARQQEFEYKLKR